MRRKLMSVETARARYRPSRLRLILIAEAPPADPARFFYFPNVTSSDALFLSTVRALYEDAADTVRVPASILRRKKEQLLRAIQRDGVWLLDACSKPMPPNASPGLKLRLIQVALPRLRSRLKQACRRRTPVILIATTVYRAASAELRAAGLRIVNLEPIAFPASGHAREFREGVLRALKSAGWRPKQSGVLKGPVASL